MRDGFKGVLRVRERDSGTVGAGRTRSRGAEKAETCGASERRNRSTVEDDGADGWVPRVSERRDAVISIGRFGPTDRGGRRGVGPGRAGRPRRVREKRSAGWAEMRRKERGERFRPRVQTNLRNDLNIYSNIDLNSDLI